MKATDLTPATILTTITAAGITCRVDGASLHLSPQSRLTPALRDAIRVHKVGLIALLTDGPGPWRYASTLLDGELWLVMDEGQAKAIRARGGVPYLPHEIRALQAMQARDPEEWPAKAQAIHAAKAVCEATLEHA